MAATAQRSATINLIRTFYGARRGLVLVLLTGLVACHQAADKPAPPPVRELSAADVLTAQPRRVTDSLPFTGTLNALVSSVVSAEVDGKVLDVRVREGERVKKGQILAHLDNQVSLEGVSEQEAQFANTQSRLQLARVKLEKQRELYQKGFISKFAFDELASDFDVKAGELKAQQSQLVRAKKTLSDSVLRAPINGVVYERKINPGEQAQRNSSLFSIADLSVLEVTATIPSQLMGRIKLGMQGQFHTEGDANRYSGRVVRLNPVALSGTRSFAVYLRVDNHDGRLRAGQFVQGGIALSEEDRYVALPLSAVRDLDDQPWVMTVEAGRLVRHRVTIHLRSELQRMAAVSGVSPGQTVLSGSLLGLKPSDAVRLPDKP